VTAVDHRASLLTPGSAVGRLTQRAGVYLALTKPRIIELLLVTTVPAMFLAADGVPPLGLVGWTLLGGTLAAGSANTLNSFLDRDIDAVMVRTGRRPLAVGSVTPRAALVFGLLLGAVAVVVMAVWVNAFSAWLSLAAILFYVLVYTLGLKRRTPQNIVWGGAAGCMPVLIGWVAVTGQVAWAPAVLFLVVFLWTPPHYWPLSLRFRDDYAAAGVPMLPVVAAPGVVSRRIVVYSWLLVGASLLLVPVAATTAGYAAAAVVLGAGWLVEAHRLHRDVRTGAALRPMRLFHFSITYLTLLFVAVALDPLLPLPSLL